MPAFRRRPLTWLFFIAANCVAAAAASRDANLTTMSVILTAQIYLVAGWAAVGGSHRLLRGAMLFVTPLATALAIYVLQRSNEEAQVVLAALLFLSGVVFVSTIAAALLVRSVRGKADDASARWQISMMETLGWTVVVAIGSAAASKAHLPPLEHIYALWGTLASAVVAGVLVALFLTPGPKHDRVGVVVAAVVLASFFAIVQLSEEFARDDSLMTAGLLAIIAVWILVVRLDEHAETAKRPHAAVEADSAALRIHAPALHDE